MDNHSTRHTAFVVGAIVLGALLISGVIVGQDYYDRISATPESANSATFSASPTPTTTNSSATVMPSATPTASADMLTITDPTKKFRWNEISFQYPGNWTAGTEQNVYQGIKFTSTSKETISITCPIPEIGFEGWDFGNPLMEMKQNVPGTDNQYQKILSIAQPVLDWGANGEAVLDPTNTNGNGWVALMMVRKFAKPNVPGIQGCMIRAIYDHSPTATEQQSLQTVYNSIAIELADTKVVSEVEASTSYTNPSYGFSIDFPKSWQKIQETNVTMTANKDVAKPYQAVLRFTPEGAPANSGKQVTIMIHNQDQLDAEPANVDSPGIVYLGKNNQYGYYWSGSQCDAAMASVTDCRTMDEVLATNKEIAAIKHSFKIGQ